MHEWTGGATLLGNVESRRLPLLCPQGGDTHFGSDIKLLSPVSHSVNNVQYWVSEVAGRGGHPTVMQGVWDTPSRQNTLASINFRPETLQWGSPEALIRMTARDLESQIVISINGSSWAAFPCAHKCITRQLLRKGATDLCSKVALAWEARKQSTVLLPTLYWVVAQVKVQRT